MPHVERPCHRPPGRHRDDRAHHDAAPVGDGGARDAAGSGRRRQPAARRGERASVGANVDRAAGGYAELELLALGPGRPDAFDPIAEGGRLGRVENDLRLRRRLVAGRGPDAVHAGRGGLLQDRGNGEDSLDPPADVGRADRRWRRAAHRALPTLRHGPVGRTARGRGLRIGGGDGGAQERLERIAHHGGDSDRIHVAPHEQPASRRQPGHVVRRGPGEGALQQAAERCSRPRRPRSKSSWHR